MMTGKVKSSSDEKRYGFILGDDKITYFFHYNDFMQSKDNVKIGNLVRFASKPTPKGMKAVEISIIENQFPYYEFGKELIICKTMEPKYNKVLFLSGVFEASARDINKPLEMLKSKAKEFGCNAILCLEYRRTSVTDDGNYYYSWHTNIGRLALIGKEEFTDNEEKSEMSKKELQNKIADIQEHERLEEEAKKERDSMITEEKHSMRNIFITVIIAIVLFIILFNTI